MPRTHDILAVHGVGEQLRGDTLVTFAEGFYDAVRQAVQEAKQDPNQEVKLLGRYQENYMEVHYRDEIFRLWEISWERSFKVPSARKVLSWLWQWGSLYLSWAYAGRREAEMEPHGRGPLPRSLLLLFALLDLTLFVPLLAALYWLWAAARQVRYQKAYSDQVASDILTRRHLATGLALALCVPIIAGLQLLARLGRAGAGLPFVGGLATRMAQSIEDLVIGSLGDVMLYIFDSVQAAFIRGELEQIVEKVYEEAIEEGREPLIHIIGHSLGSVIAYEAVSYSLKPELRQSVKTLFTMGTVLDMIRYVLSSGGMVLEERVRFGQDIPLKKQGDTYPRWLNLFARNDPATGFGPLLEFDGDPTNWPVRSTPQGHSTYWSDVRGVHRPFLAWVARGNPVLEKLPSPPPPDSQSSILKDVAQRALKLLALVPLVAAVALAWDQRGSQVEGQLSDAALPWPLSWLATVLIWLLSSPADLVGRLPQWYLLWLLWLGALSLLWVLFLGLPTLLRGLWRRFDYRRRVPLDKGARLDYWTTALKDMGPDHVLALRKKGIWTLHDFLVAAVHPGGPERLARVLDVSQEQVLEWARQANLMRLRGVGPERAALLMAAGVDSLTTLSQQERGALVDRMRPALKGVDLPRMPAGKQVEEWIARARTLRDVI
jgi:hypothetical protein